MSDGIVYTVGNSLLRKDTLTVCGPRKSTMYHIVDLQPEKHEVVVIKAIYDISPIITILVPKSPLNSDTALSKLKCSVPPCRVSSVTSLFHLFLLNVLKNTPNKDS